MSASRFGQEVDLPHGYTNRLIIRGSAPKQDGILVSDFGLAMGKSCAWATRWCKTSCYAQFSHCDWRNPASLNCLRRRTWAQHQPGEAWFAAIMTLPEGAILRLGRSGDVAHADVAQAVCEALLARPDIHFMWPTRSWLQGRKPQPWNIISRYLPGKVLCSTDPTISRTPPPGWPVASVSEPPEYLVEPRVRKCPHYETGMGCRSCLACFTTSASTTPLLSVAFKLHTCRGAFRPRRCDNRTAMPVREKYATKFDYLAGCDNDDCVMATPDCDLYDV